MRVLACALYDNEAESPDELHFRKGDVLEVVARDGAALPGWWLCSLHGHRGLVPANRLALLAPSCGGSSPPGPSFPASAAIAAPCASSPSRSSPSRSPRSPCGCLGAGPAPVRGSGLGARGNNSPSPRPHGDAGLGTPAAWNDGAGFARLAGKHSHYEVPPGAVRAQSLASSHMYDVASSRMYDVPSSALHWTHHCPAESDYDVPKSARTAACGDRAEYDVPKPAAAVAAMMAAAGNHGGAGGCCCRPDADYDVPVPSRWPDGAARVAAAGTCAAAASVPLLRRALRQPQGRATVPRRGRLRERARRGRRWRQGGCGLRVRHSAPGEQRRPGT
ncbi:embryonal Fyn-associated substrate-like isoform X2 [Lethenteron reissneri]|uniref:embryonal Fyn-associated substrate-like isoform X2 n=1 Tax=Lethenteron reissneri TaxID=7753 RepID=UPI002AB792DD|nr:embryonal Fyn-associated substrate-like isoform X2 [Lethenteron reissneri]